MGDDKLKTAVLTLLGVIIIGADIFYFTSQLQPKFAPYNKAKTLHNEESGKVDTLKAALTSPEFKNTLEQLAALASSSPALELSNASDTAVLAAVEAQSDKQTAENRALEIRAGQSALFLGSTLPK